MIYKNMEFFNVMELAKVDEQPGLQLLRFPNEVSGKMGSYDRLGGRAVSQYSIGCEIRFVNPKKQMFKISLSSYELDTDVLIYRGSFFHSRHLLKAGVITTLRFGEPPIFSKVRPEALTGHPFSSDVWRIMFSCKTTVIFHGIDTFGFDLRPPYENEVPELTWLAYGSSITTGAGAQLHNNSFIQLAADKLGVNVLDKGLPGACQCEKGVSDFIAGHGNWDFATLELGINMRVSFSVKEFEERAQYLIKTVLDKNPGKKVIVISTFPNYAGYFPDVNDAEITSERGFNDKLREIVADINNADLHLIEGAELLSNFTGLSCDLLHPSDFGHIMMAENLVGRLKEIVGL